MHSFYLLYFNTQFFTFMIHKHVLNYF